MDISSEMIHAILPVYLVRVLGASMLSVGLIEGIAEATASISKVFSGALSDRARRRKLLAGIGYGLSAVTKPLFALAASLGPILAARFIDRLGKGIRGAPRDALVADITPDDIRGTSFGLRQSLDTVGAFLGPIVAIGLMALTANAFRTVFWIAAVPAALAVSVLIFGVREPERHELPAASAHVPHLGDTHGMGRPFWTVLAVATAITLARCSEAFLVLRAQQVGLAITLVPVVMIAMNTAYALSAYPAGALADRFGRRGVLSTGVVFLIIADLLLGLGATIPLTLLGALFWGLHMGFSQGVFSALVADTAPAHLRGSAFGLFNFAVGLAMLAASVIAGALWQLYGPSATFLAGAAFAMVSLLGMAATGRDAP